MIDFTDICEGTGVSCSSAVYKNFCKWVLLSVMGQEARWGQQRYRGLKLFRFNQNVKKAFYKRMGRSENAEMHVTGLSRLNDELTGKEHGRSGHCKGQRRPVSKFPVSGKKKKPYIDSNLA